MKKILLVATILFVLPFHIYSDETKGPEVAKEARVLGIIDYNGQSQNVITAPNSVKPGKEFEVKIATQSGGCEREGDTSVVLMQNGASITLYDFTTATQPGVACAMILKTFTHTVTLKFDQPGEMLLRVWGRAIGADTPPDGQPVVVEKKITVEK
jgi:hypothetical protein